MKFLVMVRTVLVDALDSVLAIFPAEMTTEEVETAAQNKELPKKTEKEKKHSHRHSNHHSQGRRRRHHRKRNPTLAQTGGLPPTRESAERLNAN